MSAIYINDAYEVVDPFGRIDLWFVRGFPAGAFPTKMAAEVAARAWLPVEAVEEGTNSLVYFKTFIQEDSL